MAEPPPRLLPISPPDLADAELPLLLTLLEAGAELVHLRLPSASAERLRRLLGFLPLAVLGRVVVHGHPELAAEYPLAGCHLPWCPVPPLPAVRCSLSAHDLAELPQTPPGIRYLLLAPVFASLSKPGHGPAFDPAALPTALATCPAPVLALGGITPRRLAGVARLGFAGAAVLGWLWSDRDPAALAARWRRLAAAAARAWPDAAGPPA